jgi:hypothetical protein
MKLVINGSLHFPLTPARVPSALVQVQFNGGWYCVDAKEQLQALLDVPARDAIVHVVGVARSEMPRELSIFGQGWLRNDENGTYNQKLDPITIITINETDFELRAHPSPKLFYSVGVDGVTFEINGEDRDTFARYNLLDEIRVEGFCPTKHHERPEVITIFDHVWLLNFGGTYNQKPAKPFPHAGQTVSLDGVEIEVLHLDRGIVFWYNPEDEIHGMVRAEKLKSSLAETMRADLAKGLGPKELIALGWSRELC